MQETSDIVPASVEAVSAVAGEKQQQPQDGQSSKKPPNVNSNNKISNKRKYPHDRGGSQPFLPQQQRRGPNSSSYGNHRAPQGRGGGREAAHSWNKGMSAGRGGGGPMMMTMPPMTSHHRNSMGRGDHLPPHSRFPGRMIPPPPPPPSAQVITMMPAPPPPPPPRQVIYVQQQGPPPPPPPRNQQQQHNPRHYAPQQQLQPYDRMVAYPQQQQQHQLQQQHHQQQQPPHSVPIVQQPYQVQPPLLTYNNPIQQQPQLQQPPQQHYSQLQQHAIVTHPTPQQVIPPLSNSMMSSGSHPFQQQQQQHPSSYPPQPAYTTASSLMPSVPVTPIPAYPPQQQQQQHPQHQYQPMIMPQPRNAAISTAAAATTMVQPPTYSSTSSILYNHASNSSIVQQQQPSSMMQQQQQSIPTPSSQHIPIAASAQQQQQQQSNCWSEHSAPNGTKYYYNATTGESTYERPAELGGPEPNKVVASKAAATTMEQSTTHKKAVWKEYKDPTSGKFYYSDGQTSSWEKPVELPLLDEQKQQTSSTADTSTIPTARKSPFASKEEAEQAFRTILIEKKIGPTAKWTEVVKLCSSSLKWDACSQMLASGSKKQILAEYQAKKDKEDKETKRLLLQNARREFRELLQQKIPTIPAIVSYTEHKYILDSFLTSSSTNKSSNNLILDETARQELFYDYIEELKKQSERIRDAKKRAAQASFQEFLQEKKLLPTHTWASFRASLSEKDLLDKRFQVSEEMTDLDRQIFFSQEIQVLQHAQEEELRQIREAKRRQEKIQRDEYRNNLADLARQGIITITSRWNYAVEDVIYSSSEEIFRSLKDQDPQLPRDIFEDFVQDIREVYLQDYPLLEEWIASSKFHVAVNDDETTSTSLEEFRSALLEAAFKNNNVLECKRILNREPVSSATLLFNELVVAAKSAFAAKAAATLTKEEESEDEGEILEI